MTFSDLSKTTVRSFIPKSTPIEPTTPAAHSSERSLTIEEFAFYFRSYLFPFVCFTTLTLFRVLSFVNVLLIAFLYFTFPSIVRMRYSAFGTSGRLDELKVNAEAILGLFASSTALFLQVDHTAISIAIKGHGDFYLRPLSRFLRTVLFLELALGGTSMEKEQTASWLRYLHRNIQGPITSRMRKEFRLPSSITEYGFSHELKVYVLESLIWSTISFLERFDRRLSKREKDIIVLEFTCIGLRLDIPSNFLPHDYDSFLVSFRQRLDQLAVTEKHKLTCEVIGNFEDGILNTKMNWITSFFLCSSLIIGHDLLPEQVKKRYELKLLDSKWKKLRQRLMISTLWLIYPLLPPLPLRGLLSLLLLLEPKLRPTFRSSLNTVHSMDILTDKPTYASQQSVDPFINVTDKYTSWLGLPSRRDTRASTLQILLLRTLEARISSNQLSAWFFYPLSLCSELLQGWWHDSINVWAKYRSQIVESRMYYPGGKYNRTPNLPNHVGLVMDGNRRFARRRGQPVIQGHAKGAVIGSSVVEWWLNYLPDNHSIQLNRPRYLTCWAFSSENFSRPPSESEGLFRLMQSEFKSLAFASIIHLFRVRVCVIGGEKDLARLPAKLKETIEMLEKYTREYDDFVLTLAVGYGGRKEIMDSVQRIIDRNEEITEASISSETYCAKLGIPPVDLIVRTSERRFFLWDTQAAELHFVDKLWPELTELDWLKSLQSFTRREIRRGK